MIIVGYVQFRLKLNLEAILESKAILLQKICSSHQNERIALGLCQPKFVKKLDCRLFVSCRQHSDRACNPCGRKIRNLGQFYQFIKTANTATASKTVRSSKHTLDMSDKASPAWRKPKSEGSTSATKGKSRKSLAFSLLEKIKKT